MTAKEFLSQIVENQEEINRIEQYIEMLKSALTSIGVSYDGERVQTSPDPDKISATFAMIDEEEAKKTELQKKNFEIRLRAIKLINEIENGLFRDVLNMKYLQGMSFKEIANDKEYTYEYIVEVHGKALKEIDIILY